MIDSSKIPPHLAPPDPNTEEGRKKIEEIRRHHEGIGNLIMIFPTIEVQLFTTLGSLWHLPLPIARAIYGDLRVDNAMGMARKLLEARKQLPGINTAFEAEIAKWLDYVFVQLAIINGIRNHIVHHGIMGSIDFSKPVDFVNPIVSNRLRARAESHVKEIPMSSKEIEAINFDLAGIGVLLPIIGIAIMAGPSPKSAEAFAMLEKAQRENPWRYKSPLQGGKKDKTPDKAQGQPPPPQASPA